MTLTMNKHLDMEILPIAFLVWMFCYFNVSEALVQKK